MNSIEVIEFTDPGCVWSWSSEPKLRRLRHQYGDKVSWRRVFGIQVDDVRSSFPDRDPVDGAEEWRGDWLAVAAHSDTPITQRLEWMHSSTWPASRAAKAAELQGDAIAEAVLRRLREAVFVDGRPADDADRIAAALTGVPGLDLERLLDDLDSTAVATALGTDFDLTRDPHPDVVGLKEDGPHPGAAKAEGPVLRYAFPTLIVTGPEGERVMPGWRSLAQYEAAFEAVAPELRGTTPEVLDPADALARYRSLSGEDLRLLTCTDEPPSEAIGVATATTPLWLHPVEAESRAAIAAGF
ncbi:MAG: DsbA family protein [Proteobacteria bacterium]|nr:DsbA family protein [Pseudomonadota bacterium]